MEVQQDEHFEASDFYIMGWGYYQWNNTVLPLACNKKHEILFLSSKGSLKAKSMSNITPKKPMFAIFVDTCQVM